jgi:hypothetical protein
MIEIKDFHPKRKQLWGTRNGYVREDLVLLTQLNLFIEENNVEVINTETIIEKYEHCKKYSLRLWYRTKKIKKTKL